MNIKGPITVAQNAGLLMLAMQLIVITVSAAEPTKHDRMVNDMPGNTKADTLVNPLIWTLTWEDDFPGDVPNSNTWTRCERGKSDWNNTMSDDPRLLEVKDGILHLRGIANDRKDDDAPYLTAGLTSKGKYSFKYGKVQIRAKFKSAQGAWPALWMMGEEKGWPANGEIDLMEHLNFDSKVYQTVHSEYTVKLNGQTPAKSGTAAIKSDDWNTYGCEWDADKIVFTVNDKPTFTYPRVPDNGEKQWPFTQPFYFILSMQIGGKWVNGAGPTNPDHYPAGMEIDWIRVYERSEPSSKVGAGDGK